MGEVYRARDTRLNRDVAVKVLPPAFADDSDRRARFEREAQAVATLSHPNIVAIFDTGLQPGADGHGAAALYVVMELLSGQTLRERLIGGPIPVRKAVEIAVQIARGLGAAHGKGLIHRDLKPENVFLLEDGQVKILDFGLARQLAAPSHSGATQTIAATDPGTVMGTVGYMAPEQVRGQTVDARADVFAFGVVLYEMITGVPAFKRETAADTMTAILTQDPPELTGSRPDFPASLDRIIRHCLEKNPNERFQSARDVAFALEALSGSSTGSGVTSTTGSAAVVSVPAAPVRHGLSPVIVAALIVAALAAGAFVARAFRPVPPESLTFTMKTFDSQSIFNGRFMPDGETIVFSAAPTGNIPNLYEIRAGTLEARQFGPPDTQLLSVSSKGELAVLTNAVYRNHRVFSGTLARMTIEGSPKPWLEDVREGDWNPDGTTLAVTRDVNGRDVLEYPIGTKLYESGAGGYLSDPRVSPDGSRVAFMEHPARYDDRGYVRVIDASRTVTTLAGEFWGEQGVTWSKDGSSVYFAGNVTAADPKDQSAGQLAYQLYRVAANGKTPPASALTSPGDFTIYDIAPDGRWLASRDDIRYGVVARGAGQAEERDLSWLNKSWSPQLSPDGQRLMFADGNAGSDYGVVWRTIDGSPIAQLGPGDPGPGWSPDGKWALAVIVSRAKLVAYPIGAGNARPINTDPVTNLVYAQWMADSQAIVVFGNEPGKSPRHYRVTLSGGAPVPILPENLSYALLAPNGEIALGATPDHTFAIYALAGGPGRPIASIGTTDEPIAFSEDSRSVFIQQVGQKVPAVVDRIDIATGKRTPFKQFAPADRAGLTRIYVSGPVIKSDGTQYAYGYVRRPSVLFVVNGAAR
jgi:serine/threonine protein kinase